MVPGVQVRVLTRQQRSVGVEAAHLVLSQTAGVQFSYGLPRRCSSSIWQSTRVKTGRLRVRISPTAPSPVRIWVSLLLFHSSGAGSSPARGTRCPVAQSVKSAALIQRRPAVQSRPGQHVYWPCRAVGSSPPCHGGGRGFKPRQGRHGVLAHVGRAPALQAGCAWVRGPGTTDREVWQNGNAAAC